MPDQCGPTHYTGCPCHEARRDRLLKAAEKVVEAAKHLRARIQAGDVPRYAAMPGAALNACVEDFDGALAAYDAIRKEANDGK